MKSIFNGILDFQSEDEFEIFINSMDNATALKIIELAVNYGQQNGLYEFQESYLIYKCLKKLKDNYGNQTKQ